MKAIEKFIPGFSRFVINKKGEIKNHHTGTVQKPDPTRNNKVLLRNDDNKNERVVPEQLVEQLFPKPTKKAKEVDNFAADTTKIVKQVSAVAGVRTRNLKQYDFDSMTAEEKAKVHASNKLTTIDVIRIRHLLDNKIKTKKEIGIEYGMSQQNAGRVGNRKIYTNIPEQAYEG